MAVVLEVEAVVAVVVGAVVAGEVMVGVGMEMVTVAFEGQVSTVSGLRKAAGGHSAKINGCTICSPAIRCHSPDNENYKLRHLCMSSFFLR